MNQDVKAARKAFTAGYMAGGMTGHKPIEEVIADNQWIVDFICRSSPEAVTGAELWNQFETGFDVAKHYQE